MVVIGSMVSSLRYSLAASPDAALHQPSCPIFDRLFTAFDRFYFSLHFKHKRNLPACDVQFVPKYRSRWLVGAFETNAAGSRRIAAFARQNWL